MLRRLLIQDYLLIEHTEIEPGNGFCVFTGETGAGKSMVLGALAVLVGEKFPNDPVKSGAKKAVIEGEFDVPEESEIRSLLSASEVDVPGETVLLRREVAQGGRARCFVNDEPVALEILQSVGERLVDLHGQHEQQALMKRARHLDFFDAFAETIALRSEVAYHYREHARLRADFEMLQRLQEERRRDEGLLRFQLSEIQRLNLREGEEEVLEEEVKRLESAEKLANATHRAWEALSDGDSAAAVHLRRAREALAGAKEIDPELDGLAREIEQAEAQVRDLGKLARDSYLSVRYDPERLETLRERRSALSVLKRKYGLSIGELLHRAEQWRSALSDSDSLEADIERKRQEVQAAATALREKALKLSEMRRKEQEAFESAVRKQLSELGLGNASFELSWDSGDDKDANHISAKGIDKIEFSFSANPGRAMKPLVEVASGGEVSRIMLALKRVFADNLEPMTLVFDEIDIGISGRMAERVAEALNSLARRHQVLAITHLPQIAGRAEQHFAVTKRTSRKETVTEVRRLSTQERIQELALLLGGTRTTPKIIATAEELVGRGRATKKNS
jgi:DNA repair protein RecN (Recombination protein N)